MRDFGASTVTGPKHSNSLLHCFAFRGRVKRRPGKDLALPPLKHKGWRAQELIEFAVIFPILILFVFGIIDLGRVFQVLIAISNAAREGARHGISYGFDRSTPGAEYILYETIIDNAAIQEAGNFDLKLTAAQVTPSCPETCIAGKPLRVVVTYTFKPIIPIVFPASGLNLVRDMEMVIP